ncbi:MAG: sucrase ferredoxin [Myxococcota bacterium]
MIGSCRESAISTEEPLAGSAGSADFWFGIAWPKPHWDPLDAARSRGLPEALARIASEPSVPPRRVAIRVFQRGPGASRDPVELVALETSTGRSARVRRAPLDRLEPLMRSFLGGQSIGPPLQRPLLLVCSDGRHDRCCALHGRRLFGALRRAAPAGLEVAESSHLGGHRFAPTVLVLPEGRLYGRLSPADAPMFLEAIESGRIPGTFDRGRISQSELAQLAEAAVRERVGDHASVRVEAAGPPVDGRPTAQLYVRTPSGRLEVRCRLREFCGRASCDAPEEPRSRWTVSAVEFVL